jgi:hypothetical protein
MIEAALLVFSCALGVIFGALAVVFGYELGRRATPGYLPPKAPTSIFSRKTQPERRKPVVNSDERLWAREQEEKAGKPSYPVPPEY